MMPKYLFECPKCKRQYSRYKRVEQRDAPEYCDHTVTIGGGVKHFPHKMNRIFSASFQIIGSRQADSPDNDLYRIITNNGTKAEQLELMRKDAAAADKENAELAAIHQEKPVTVSDIMGKMGLAEAARSGDIGIHNWREKNIPKEPTFATD